MQVIRGLLNFRPNASTTPGLSFGIVWPHLHVGEGYFQNTQYLQLFG